MPLSRTRDYLSIGEVLEALKSDFPDISISKIRFLEGEGLIQPERTPSGYRKFYDSDVDRLRSVLALQRDQFLPLKVIKQRLSADPSGSNAGASRAGPGKSRATQAASGEAPRDRLDEHADRADSAAAELHLSRAELAKRAGLSDEELLGLEDFGILRRSERHDGHDLAVARAAKELAGYGFEPRHLRMYRQSSEREASLISQIVSPLLHKRDPKGQQEAEASLGELLRLSRQLREGLLRTSLREQG